MDKAVSSPSTSSAAPAVESRGAGSAGAAVGGAPVADAGLEGGDLAAAQGAYGNAFVAGTVGGRTQASAAAGLPPGFDPEAKARALQRAMEGWGTDERAILDVLYSGGTSMNQAVASAYQRLVGRALEADLRAELSGADLERALLLLAQGQYTLADKIREGARGWGTDETRIYQALERATPAELAQVKADAQVLGILRDELSGDDFRLACAYLDGQGVLASALRRAIAGWGTDEDAIWTALSKASPEEKAFVLQQPALTADLRADLSDEDWFRCEKLLRGTLDNVDRIEMAMMGWGTDEGALQAALGALTPEEYGRLPADLDARLEGELSGRDLVLAREALHQRRLELDAAYRNAYLARQQERLGEGALVHEGASALLSQQGQAQSAVGRLVAACAGLGTDDTTLWQVLAELSAAERDFLRQYNPDGVLDILRDDLSAGDYQRVLAILGGGGPAAVLQVAAEGFGTDEGLVYRALDRALAEGSAAALLADGATMGALRRDLSAGRFALVQEVLTTGRFTARQRLQWATLDAGTDEDLVFALASRYAAELREGDEVAPDVDRLLQAELSTRDLWRARDAIRGEPRSESQRLDRAKETLERERGGVSTALMDGFSSSGERADDAWREYQASYNLASTDGQISAEETGRLRRDESFSLQSTADYAEAKGAVAMWATQIAVAVVGIAATILTAGAAGPFVAGLAASMGGNLAVAAEAMVMAAALKVGLNRAIQGEGYDLSSTEALLDGVAASLEVGLNVVGARVAMKMAEGLSKMAVARSVGPAVEKVFGGAGRRILGAGLEGGIDGTIGGVGEGAFAALAAERTWKGDVEKMFGDVSSTMVMRAAMSGTGGFLSKAGFASIGEIWGGRARTRLDEDAGRHPVPEGPDGGDTGKALRRQQDEALPGVVDKHKDLPWQDYERGKPFVKGEGDELDIDPHDVKQGALGDCYLMAGMAATARAEPEAIRRIIKDNGDGTFEVTLFVRERSWTQPRAVTKTIDARLATKNGKPVYAGLGDSTGEGDELWPALLEKRLAQQKGSYDQISGGNIAKGFEFHGATELFTGKAERYFPTTSLSEDKVLQVMQSALDAKKPITVDSKDMANLPDLTQEANKVNVYGNHAYAVQSVNVANKTVTLQNPWGSHHVTDLPVKDFLRFYRAVRVGGG